MSGNYHCHSRYDDGHGELEEYLEAALDKGLGTLGYSAHAPLPFPCDWTMPPRLLPEYLNGVRALKERGRTEVLSGLEVDYIPGILSPASPWIKALKLDFSIGSVHFVGRLQDGRLWTVDGPPEELEQGIRESCGGDSRRAVREYYRLLAAMLRESPPDIVGHFDVIKKNNREERYFSENAPWYRQLVLETLDAVAASGCLLEVNTGGIVRNTSAALYPSQWILGQCLLKDVPLILSSDAHRPEQLDGWFPQARDLLKRIGFRKVVELGQKGRRVVAL